MAETILMVIALPSLAIASFLWGYQIGRDEVTEKIDKLCATVEAHTLSNIEAERTEHDTKRTF